MATAAIIAGGTALVGSSLYSAHQAGKASDAQVGAAEQSSDTQLQMFREGQASQKKMYEKGRADTAPWREAGKRSLGALEQRMEEGPGEYTESPGYQFRLKEGQKNILAQRGNYRSGATDKALVRYGEDYATNDYDNFLSRYYQSLRPMQSLAGVGQTTATQGAQAGQQYASGVAGQGMQTAGQVGQNLQSAGAARASGYAGQANAFSNLVGQGAGLAAMTYGGPGWTWGGQ